MTRLTSLASVLAALEIPQRNAARTERQGQPGYQIWEGARRQAQFYIAYAEMLEPGRQSREPGESWVQEVYPDGRWVGPAALATSYRVAAQHAALVDPGWATRLAVRAGMAYVSAGLPFGLFLLTGLLDDQTLSDSSRIGEVVEPFRTRDITDAPEAIRHPVQLTYLLLAAASRPWLRDPLRRTLNGAERRLAARSLYPIGPQGVPLGEYLDLAATMRDEDDPPRLGDNYVPAGITRQVAGLCRTQAATLRAAQRNRYLWQNAVAPVIDLEQVALSGLALRHRPWFSELSEAITTELARDDELAQLPVWTMGEIESELPEIVGSVSEIMREPERAWRTDDFREPDTEAYPWTEEPLDRSAPRVPDEEAQPGYPDTRPETRLYGYPGSEYGDTDWRPEYGEHSGTEQGGDEEDGGDDPFFGDR